MPSVVAMPKELDPTARIADGFTPSAISVGPDGIPAAVPVRPPSKLALIPLCTLGPCVRYHELVTKMDAQDPQDGSEGEVFTNRTRTCYPSPGIEMDISVNPVHQCNLWEPDINRARVVEAIRAQYEASTEGAIEMDRFHASWPQKTVVQESED